MAINFFVCHCNNIGEGCIGKHTTDSLEVYDFLVSISSLKKLRRSIEFGGMIKRDVRVTFGQSELKM